MVYNPATDFVGLWRSILGTVSKTEMPGLDFVLAAMSRAGLITLSVSATPPLANQSTTAWLQAAVPSYSAEGVLRLWNPVTAAYVAATPALLLRMLEAAAGESGVSWWTTVGGPPANVVGNDGDYAIQTDDPGGVYGPKVGGAWPLVALPGTTNVITSDALDNTFGAVPGQIIFRGPLVWEALSIGAVGNFLVSPVSGLPFWASLTVMLDFLFSAAQGSIIYRAAAGWAALAPGLATQVLSTNGPAADPAWASRTPEFPSGTVMLFQQTAAPLGWTKQTLLNDYGLRVTSGTVGVVPGHAFSTIFAQTAVGNTTLNTTQIPAHDHPYQVGQLAAVYAGGGFNALGGNVGSNTGLTGGGLAHTHSVDLTLSYVDVIIASKN